MLSFATSVWLFRTPPRASSCARRAPACVHAAGNGDAVAVHFVGSLDNGEIFADTRSTQPFRFTVGSGAVLRAFDEAVRGLRIGESRSVRVRATDAYGPPNRALVVRIPVSRIAPRREHPHIGDTVALDNGRAARVLSVTDNGDVTVDANHPLVGRALHLSVTLLDVESRQLPPMRPGLQWAIFAMATTTAAELAFRNVRGVRETCTGYAGGHLHNPSYIDVVRGESDHAESIAVGFDPCEVTYEELLTVFWKQLGSAAFTLNRCGNDVGSQYRSALFCLDAIQLNAARESRANLNARLGKGVVTDISMIDRTKFYVAEVLKKTLLQVRAVIITARVSPRTGSLGRRTGDHCFIRVMLTRGELKIARRKRKVFVVQFVAQRRRT